VVWWALLPNIGSYLGCHFDEVRNRSSSSRVGGTRIVVSSDSSARTPVSPFSGFTKWILKEKDFLALATAGDVFAGEPLIQSNVIGTTMPVLEFVLESNEAIISKAGELSWMGASILMTTRKSAVRAIRGEVGKFALESARCPAPSPRAAGSNAGL
jgi:hypothetical protein